jgi:tRNA-Thr(GGU) m(6)t(6)A37 methyltransferase TsaA
VDHKYIHQAKTLMTSDKHDIVLRPVGVVRSEHHDRAGLPHQGRGQGIRAVIELDPQYLPAAREIKAGDNIWVLWWFHMAERDRLRVHPRGDAAKPLKGVFSLRSPARPNPIAMSLVTVTDVNGHRIEVSDLEALDGTPVLDIKPHSAVLDV